LGLANVDDEAGERARAVELRRRPVEDADCSDIEEEWGKTRCCAAVQNAKDRSERRGNVPGGLGLA
jgi:hypothetical protein